VTVTVTMAMAMALLRKKVGVEMRVTEGC